MANSFLVSKNPGLVTLLFLLITLVVISISNPALSETTRERDLSYSISLESSLVYADVSSASGGVVIINGSVTLTAATDVTIDLEGYTLNYGWDTTVSPSELQFFKTGSNSKDFFVEILVPHGTCAEISEIVQINGSWETLGLKGTIAPETAVIDILQYSSVTVQPVKNCVGFNPVGEVIEFPVIIKNQGNGDDSFDITLDDGYGSDFGFPTRISLGFGDEAEEALLITIPDRDNIVSYTINLQIESAAFDSTALLEIKAYIQNGQAIIAAGIGPFLVVHRQYEMNTASIQEFTPGMTGEVNVEVIALLGDVRDITFEINADDGFTLVNEPAPFNMSAGEWKTVKLEFTYSQTNDELLETPSRIVMLSASGIGPKNLEVDSNDLRLLANVNIPKTESSIWESEYVAPVAAVTAGAVIGLVAFASYASSEVGRYKLLGLLFVPLYSKIHKDKVLDHFARGRLYEYIKIHPGVTFSALKSELEMGNGTLTYHLTTLEREELIKSTKDGRHRCFYLTGTKVPAPGIKDDILEMLDGVDRKIYELIQGEPGITQVEVFRSLEEYNLAQRTVSNHIKMMERRGLIELKRDGKDKRCFVAEA